MRRVSARDEGKTTSAFWPMSAMGIQYPTRCDMVGSKQRIALGKALEEGLLQPGAERAMASVFWATSRQRSRAQLRVLGEVRPIGESGSRRGF